jgi:hypothetical protein
MQASRFEQKYLVSERTALQIRDFVQGHMDLDENGVDKPDHSYPVHSLYLDSDDLKLYWATINGDKNRYKLRLRFYNDDPDTPVFCEIKRRMNNCISKLRGGVRRAVVSSLLAGQLPDPLDLLSRDERQLAALQRFCQLIEEIHARPKLHVAYRREAYVPRDDNSARLTMDREVRVRPQDTPELTTDMEAPVLVWGKQVVVELKFTSRYPAWFGQLVRRFGLQQRGAAKYVDGVEMLEEAFGLRPNHRLRHGAVTRDEGRPAMNLPDEDATLITRHHDS